MNLRQLEVFRTIMQCRSITDAARVLNVSQPAVTKVLRHAEDQLGIRLFQRERGRLIPTNEAELLYPDTERIFRELQSLKRLSADLRDGTTGLLRIGASASLAMSVVPDALKTYRQDYPGVRITCHLLPAVEMAEMVMAHQLDLGVSVAPIVVPSARTEQIHTADIICVMPEGHPLTALRTVSPHDAAQYTLISFSSAASVGQLLETAFRRAGVVRRIDVEVTLALTACAMVQRGMGIAMVDGFSSRLDFAGLTWRPFRPRLTQSVNLVTASTPSRFAGAFVPYLRRVLRSAAPPRPS